MSNKTRNIEKPEFFKMVRNYFFGILWVSRIRHKNVGPAA